MGRGRGSSSKSLPNAMRHIVIIRTHLNHTSTPLPKTCYGPPPNSLQILPTTPTNPLPQRPEGVFAHVLSHRFVRVILARGHASMALNLVHFSDLCWQQHSSSSEASQEGEFARMLHSTENCTKLEDALPSYCRIRTTNSLLTPLGGSCPMAPTSVSYFLLSRLTASFVLVDTSTAA